MRRSRSSGAALHLQPKPSLRVAMIAPDCTAVSQPQSSAPATGLEKSVRALSVFTLLMTVPQVVAVWVDRDVGGVSVLSWGAYLISACLWFVYGLQKRDKTIYLACVGWVLLDAAIVAGVIVHR
jgi:uncharacterized protein with PQ loop repeat